MSQNNHRDDSDQAIQTILAGLAPYQEAHPNANIRVRRQNPVAIRIRIIDPDFEGINVVDREDELWRLLTQLPEEIVADITVLLLLTPAEATHSLANVEFDDPISSRL